MGNKWLERRLEQLGKSKAGLARAIGEHAPRINEMIDGTREVHIPEIVPMANYLEMGVVEVIAFLTKRNPGDLPRVPVMLKGVVQAGAWMQEAHWSREQWEPVPFPVPDEYRNVGVFLLRVQGDSMDLVYPDGTLILCAPVWEVDREPQAGNRVIVQRQDSAGAYEVTVKEFSVSSDGRRWLVPRSTKPEFQAPLEWPEGTVEVKIMAYVIGSFKPEQALGAGQHDLPVRKARRGK